MNYDSEKLKKFENELLKEITEYQKKKQEDNDEEKIKRILSHLEKYGR